MAKIRVLIVDDSMFMQRIIKRMVDAEADMEVIGIARDGIEGVEKIHQLRPDCATLDINMPNRSGLEVLDHFKGKPPCPIIVLSGFKQSDAQLSLIALNKGAFDFICKPSGELSMDLDKVKEELLLKIRSTPLAHSPTEWATLQRPPASISSNIATMEKQKSEPALKRTALDRKMKSGCIVGIAISTGGPNLLNRIIPEFPENFPAAIVIAQHMPPIYTKELAKRLNSHSKLKVKEAERGEPILSGNIYVAPGGVNIKLGPTKRVILEEKTAQTIFVPSGTILLSSLAKVCDGNCVGLILTGLGDDGSEGAMAIAKSGGLVFAQNPTTCVVEGMPNSAIASGCVTKIVEPPIIVSELVKLF